MRPAPLAGESQLPIRSMGIGTATAGALAERSFGTYVSEVLSSRANPGTTVPCIRCITWCKVPGAEWML